jgi:hypothetical protein
VRLDRARLTEAVATVMNARPDPTGQADLVCDRGHVVVAAEPAELKEAFSRLKRIDGYRWVAINREDLFAANTASLGSKAGLIDQDGKVLKAPDLPRKPV